ncbi:MAG: DNA-binding CsgD family transcriptional regulator [Brevundimonas sp.]|jgi:DNA-binding CsgD family transcriptional regulator|uniref:helix-turn-helix domain-containing protein n=1 Tax=Brevundimonas sp. TaxID=1871086 RepID=UPI0039E57D00
MQDNRLTQREVQCVVLAGKGLTDKEIAQRLRPHGRGMSPKTVSNHLHSAYQKLGTRSRDAAAAIVARNYPDPPIPMSGADLSGPDPLVAAGRKEGGEDGGPGYNPLYEAYVALGPLRTPPRWVGSRTGLILIWTLFGLMLIIAGFGVLTAFGSIDRFADDAFRSTAEGVTHEPQSQGR